MLKMKPNCECCDHDLAPESTEARICGFECTFCATCAGDRFGNVCPSCGGDLVTRPTRAAHYLERYPPVTERTPLIAGCQALPA